ncbi:hypothetical protein [Novosphingobium sp.]|uniref:hypothetical protein n=1 Tax=Novosphingobium sp. TaxID=1874826 RepID=UPI0038BADCF2
MWKPISTAPVGRYVLIRGGEPDQWDTSNPELTEQPPCVVAKGVIGVSGAIFWQFAAYDGGWLGVWEAPTEWCDLGDAELA